MQEDDVQTFIFSNADDGTVFGPMPVKTGWELLDFKVILSSPIPIELGDIAHNGALYSRDESGNYGVIAVFNDYDLPKIRQSLRLRTGTTLYISTAASGYPFVTVSLIWRPIV